MNVLVLMCDHHRFDALGCMGNPLARTPNLDRLASRSVRFDNCFNQSPVCAPARHSLATGRYAHAHGVLTNNHKPFPGMVTVAHALQSLNYRRYHLGHMHWTDREMDNGYEPEVMRDVWWDKMSEAVKKRFEWEAQPVTRRTTGGPSPRKVDEYWGYHVAAESIRQIEESAAKGERFLSWTSFTEPHPPFYPPKEIYESIDQEAIRLPEAPPTSGAYSAHPRIQQMQEEWAHLTDVEKKQIIAGYYGMVTLVDGYCGMVLDALDRLGIRDETLVIWTADHGDQMGEHDLFLKFNMREASVHVPLLIDDPDVDAGARGDLVEHIDLFPTICERVGADVPESVQGRSLIPLLHGDTPGDWRDAVFSQIGDVQMIRTTGEKLNVYGGEPGEYFDLKNDPGEFENRIGDAAAKKQVEELQRRLKRWEETNKA